MARILITGGAGFIGSSLADVLVQDPKNELVLLDNLLTGYKANIPDSNQYPNCKFIKCDINDFNDLQPVMLSNKFDYVFHYAAVVGVDRTLESPISVLEDIEGIKNVLHLSKNTGVKRIFYASSSEVYGESIKFPQDEISTPLNSRLPYAVVKNVGESFVRSYHQEFGLEYTIFRFFNTYGQKQNTDFVISKFMRMALNNQPITVYGDGLQSRTFCYIGDNIAACNNAVNNDLFINDVFNVGNDIEVPVLRLAEIIIRLTNSKSEIVFLPPLAEGDMQRRLPNIDRMKKLLDRPLLTLEEGLSIMFNDNTYLDRHVLSKSPRRINK